MLMRSVAIVALMGLTLQGCASNPTKAQGVQPVFPAKTQIQRALNDLPSPAAPIAVAVYGFQDQTGQFKASDQGQNLSRATTQGAGAMLVKSLQEAGRPKIAVDAPPGRTSSGWFTVVEREQFKNLLNERQVISEMRARYLGEQGVNPQALPALLFAGVLLEGGVITYDTNTRTGGAGAAILGIGSSVKYRQDMVSVYLRAVSVKTGEVLTTVTAAKTIRSVAVDVNVFRYVDDDRLLETETGFTTNEPGQLALQQAIDKAVYGLVLEGVDLKLWDFADAQTGWPYLWRYRQERDGAFTPRDTATAKKVADAAAAAPKPARALAASAKTTVPAPAPKPVANTNSKPVPKG